MKDWNSYEKAAEKGPLQIGTKIILGLFILGVLIWGLSFVVSIFTGTAEVAKQEFSAGAMLKKYEWFKNAAAELDKKSADIQVYQARITAMEADYAGTPRKDWPRTDKEQMNVWQSEVAGVKASFNGLAAEYNSQMAKFNWSFANVGQLPQGATTPLPREYKTYVEQ